MPHRAFFETERHRFTVATTVMVMPTERLHHFRRHTIRAKLEQEPTLQAARHITDRDDSPQRHCCEQQQERITTSVCGYFHTAAVSNLTSMLVL